MKDKIVCEEGPVVCVHIVSISACEEGPVVRVQIVSISACEEGPGICAHLITLFSMLLIAASLPFSLCFVVKVVQVSDHFVQTTIVLLWD